MTREELLRDLDVATRAGDMELARVIDQKLDALGQSDPAEGATLKFGPLDTGIGLPKQATELFAGAGRRFMDIATLGNRPMNDRSADARLDKSPWATAGGAVADLSTLIGGGVALRGAAAIPQLARAPQVANAVRAVGQNMVAPTSVRNAALTAATYGAATTPGGFENRAKAAATQGAMGAAGQALPNVIGAAVKPNVAEDVADLASRGVRMTPGQLMGGRANVTEQKLMSLPFAGDMIAKARGRSIEDFNRAVADEVLSSLGKSAKSIPGRDLVRETQKVVSSSYDDVLGRISTEYTQAVDGAIDSGRLLSATAGAEGRFEAILKQDFFGKFTSPTNKLSGQTFKEVDSGLATSARNARLKGDRELAEAIDGVRDALRTSAQGSADDLSALKATDLAYAKLVRMENASAMRGAKDGVFTPAQFGNAVEKGAGRKTKAAGKELMGTFADNAERRLSTAFPNSGTADRLLLGGGLAYAEPSTLGVGAGLAGLYTRPSQAVLRGMMTKRPDWAALDQIADTARLAAPVGGLLTPYLLPVYAGQK